MKEKEGKRKREKKRKEGGREGGRERRRAERKKSDGHSKMLMIIYYKANVTFTHTKC